MKKLVVIILFLLSITAYVNAQSGILKIDLKGTTFTVSEKIPEEITGIYLYEHEGEPKIVLKSNGTGSFQPHGIDPISIKFWVDCDENGDWRKQKGINGRYQYTLLIQYLDGDNGNYPVNGYDLMGVAVLPDEGQAVIYGERYKSL